MSAEQLVQEDPLVPQTPPICALDARFCFPVTMQLHIKERSLSFSGGDFKVRDMEGKLYFRSKGNSLTLSDKTTLLDESGNCILNMKSKVNSMSHKRTIYAGNDSKKEISVFKMDINSTKAQLSASFKEPITDAPHNLVLIGNWHEKKAAVFLGEPKEKGIRIARIFRPVEDDESEEFIVEVVAGVDIALVVAMCIALEGEVNWMEIVSGVTKTLLTADI